MHSVALVKLTWSCIMFMSLFIHIAHVLCTYMWTVVHCVMTVLLTFSFLFP